MRNLRLLATVLFVAVLLVGIVLLLRQTNVQNDTSVTSNQVASEQLASNDTDPPGKVSKQKISVRDIRNMSSSSSSTTTPAAKRTNPSTTNTSGRLVPASEMKKSSNTNVSNGQLGVSNTLNKNSSEAQQIESLEIMLQRETNPKVKAKIQHKLNSLK